MCNNLLSSQNLSTTLKFAAVWQSKRLQNGELSSQILFQSSCPTSEAKKQISIQKILEMKLSVMACQPTPREIKPYDQGTLISGGGFFMGGW